MPDLFKEFQEKDIRAEEEKIERALVMCGEHGDMLVYGRGGWVESDIETGLSNDEAGPTGWVPKDTKGLWICEGIPLAIPCGGFEEPDTFEPDYRNCTWRRPTPEELQKIAVGDFTFFGKRRLMEGDEA